MKRILRSIWNSERVQMVGSRDYESWSKQQLIEKIKELEEMPSTQSQSQSQSQSQAQSQSKSQSQAQSQSKPQPDQHTNEQQTIKPSSDLKSGPNPPTKKPKVFDFSTTNTRFIALRFAYLGWNYNGLSFQFEPTPLPTVEEEILKALAKAKLVKDPEPGCCNFSRCGRTDKGVSAMNQVISLKVRSSLTPEEQQSMENDNKEIPYISILNSMLPSDIRITAISLRPPPRFDARFSCKYRHYRYIIKREGLDIDLMNKAAAIYKGVHDFRNFCKIDGSKQITNYHREVYESHIIPLDEEFVIFDLKGSAFLWHQVRCMVSVLLSVGQGLEDITVINHLLDVEKYPCRPNFEMANDIPLILYDCVFPDMEWLSPTHFNTFNKNIKEFGKLKGFVLDHQVKAHISRIMQDAVIRDEDKLQNALGAGTINLGDGKGRSYKKYVPILERDFGESYQVVNERHLQKKKRKLANSVPE